MKPCDPCVWNRLVGNQQLTTKLYADNFMMSRADPEIATECIKKLDGARDNKGPLSTTNEQFFFYFSTSLARVN